MLRREAVGVAFTIDVNPSLNALMTAGLTGFRVE
jgi:hypothetical protein